MMRNCRECRHMVSTEAETCPNCGVPNPAARPPPPPPDPEKSKRQNRKLLLIFGAMIAGSALIMYATSEEESEGTRATTRSQRPSGSSYQRRLRQAREAWLSGDGFKTTVSRHPDMTDFSLWKTPDRRNDGAPGIAPLVRARVPGGAELLVLSGPRSPDGVRMYEVTDGRNVGWISELQLDSLPP